MAAQIKCIVCRGTRIYFNSAGFGRNPEPCRYCEGTGKTETQQQRTKPRPYIAAGPGFTISEGQVSAGNLSIEYALSNSATTASRPKKTREQVHPENSGAWAVMWANALDN